MENTNITVKDQRVGTFFYQTDLIKTLGFKCITVLYRMYIDRNGDVDYECEVIKSNRLNQKKIDKRLKELNKYKRTRFYEEYTLELTAKNIESLMLKERVFEENMVNVIMRDEIFCKLDAIDFQRLFRKIYNF